MRKEKCKSVSGGIGIKGYLPRNDDKDWYFKTIHFTFPWYITCPVIYL